MRTKGKSPQRPYTRPRARVFVSIGRLVLTIPSPWMSPPAYVRAPGRLRTPLHRCGTLRAPGPSLERDSRTCSGRTGLRNGGAPSMAEHGTEVGVGKGGAANLKSLDRIRRLPPGHELGKDPA